VLRRFRGLGFKKSF